VIVVCRREKFIHYKLVDWSIEWVETAVGRYYIECLSNGERIEYQNDHNTPEQILILISQASEDRRFVSIRSRRGVPFVIEGDKCGIMLRYKSEKYIGMSDESLVKFSGGGGGKPMTL
jgi:hypothetical protein